MSETREKRDRKFTPKGQTMFDDQSNELREKCEKIWSKIEDLMIIVPSSNTLETLRQLNTDIDSRYKNFCRRSEEYKSFITRADTNESQQLISDYNEYFVTCVSTYRKVNSEIKKKKADLVEQLSQVSSSNGSSKASSKRAKAEAEKVRLEFVRKEGELMKQKAAIEADINIVKQESKVAAAETEVRILEQGDQEQDIISEVCEKKDDISNYVHNVHFQEPVASWLNQQPNIPVVASSASQAFSAAVSVPQIPSIVNTVLTSVPQIPSVVNTVFTSLSSQPNIQPSLSQYPVQQNANSTNSLLHDAMTDITRFMYRKDFLLSRFTNFDDKPEAYESWRASFQSVTRELGVTPFEEMDLLVKWLGTESSKFAKIIRAANAHDPPRGLQRIYDRLQERYGRPEMVESALKRKLNAFQTITNKDCVKLYDLLDILTEIESSMLNPKYTTLLSYYNSSSGINPIVAKLPYFLQEKWTTRASSYKKSHDIAFPPFSLFVSYIRDMCEIRNDPAFSYNSVNSTTNSKQRSSVISRRLDVSSESSVRCPLHKAGHTLNDCRGFRKYPIQDRQKFLREKRICFKCCETNEHFASNCTVNVKCAVCGNKRHATAMHIDRYTQNRTQADNEKPLTADGGEHSEDNVTVKCTTLCGDIRVGRSCGKTVLVDVYLPNSPEKSTRVYAAIDDQSNRTLITPELFDDLGIQGQHAQFNMSSCNGNSTMKCRVADSICVRSIDGKSTFELQDVIECDSIPSELPEIATPEVASAYSHLHRISSYLPPLDPSIKVELLIGRDIPEIHHVQEQITGDKGEPFAQRLALGWVVIGEVCLGKVHAPNKISVRKTHVLNDGRCTTFPLCENNIEISDLKDDIFIRTTNDNKVGLSVEDRQFLSLMDTDFRKDDTGHCGKILLREVVPPGTDWDEPLSSEHADRWNLWLESLKSLGNFEIPRMITPESVSTAHHLEIHIFCDASEQAISSVAYLKSVNETGNASLGFLMGKTKLAPLKGHTIPRLELCAAVLGAELGEVICDNMKLLPETCHYYTDSQVVLGYISNTKRRFFTYVTNRVEKIHKTSNPSQWSYISTDQNPADAGTRFSSSPDMILVTRWITGPTCLSSHDVMIEDNSYPLVTPTEDKEIRPLVLSKKTVIRNPEIGCHRFTNFSSLKALIRAVSFLRHFVRTWKSKRSSQKVSEDKDSPKFQKETESFIIRQIQNEIFEKEIYNLNEHKPISKERSMLKLDPFVDEHGVVRVGDPDSPCVLSPNALLTTKTIDCDEDFSHLNIRDVYTTQWKFVQVLAEQFWTQWRREYLQTLQSRRKWQQTQENIKEGDTVILKDGDQHRNLWPIGLIEHIFPSKDNLVRKVLVRTIRDGQVRVYVRPITQTVLLCRNAL
ncbi:unnamed protein product [Mytilus edulis]|uniref:DUF5641 domain-containing protein n=1 Tax=Mytilus edulis TaxID=6550 RepID=A0A8S3QKF3_MYTED|nr:unnamed protein product [Mytilus edulis]